MRSALALLAAVVLVAGACGGDPVVTAPPEATPATTLSPTPAATENAFAPAAWPRQGSACDTPGYEGRLGRIETPDAATVVFTLCAPDGAFTTRLAHPAMSIVDAAALARLAEDPAAARSLAGTGPYRIAAWVAGENVQLERMAGVPAAEARTPIVILSWDSSPSRRTDKLEDASVDGIDAPGPTELDRIATQPELVATPRPLLATAYLGFGGGRAYTSTRVRRAISVSLDRGAIAAAGFAEGSVVATHLAPCGIPGACEGRVWHEFNAPAGASALAEEKFDLDATYPLRVPDEPVPGLPDPLRAAEAVRAQLETNLGMTVSVEAMPLDDFRAGVAAGSLGGLYLDGVSSSLVDASAFMEPLFGEGVGSVPARRAPAAASILAEAQASTDPATRAEAFGRASDEIRTAAAVVPLAHPGEVVAYRSDVTGAGVSPLGLDPLGAGVPGDRPQLVFLQATEPDGAYCGDQDTLDAFRLCGLVMQGLYGFAPGTLEARPVLARQCDPSDNGQTWTCALRPDLAFSDGARVDAADVLATFVAQWDRAQPLRVAQPAAPFAAWEELFGDTLGGS